MKWPSTCSLPSTNLICPVPSGQHLLQHPHFYLEALYFLSLIAVQTIWTEGQGWIDPPIHTPSVYLLKQKQI